jgi:hypothetical protein
MSIITAEINMMPFFEMADKFFIVFHLHCIETVKWSSRCQATDANPLYLKQDSCHIKAQRSKLKGQRLKQ